MSVKADSELQMPSKNKPKMAYSRDLAVMDYHGVSWMTFMDDFHGLPSSVATKIEKGPKTKNLQVQKKD